MGEQIEALAAFLFRGQCLDQLEAVTADRLVMAMSSSLNYLGPV